MDYILGNVGQIKKNDFGIFVIFQIEIAPELIKKIHKELKASADIIRFIIFRMPRVEKIKEKTEIKKQSTISNQQLIEKKVEKVSEKGAEKVRESKKKIIITKEKPKEKPEIAKEIESEDERMKKLEEELDKILEE